MRRRAALPEGLGEVFTPSDALAAGLTLRRIERPDLEIPFAGVRLRLLPLDPDEHPADAWRRDVLRLVDAYRLVMTPGEFFSHETAALIWGLPVPMPPSTQGDPLSGRRVEASVLFPGRAPRGRRVAGHQVRPALCAITRHRGSPVTTPATTWAMLADRLDIPDLVALGDAIVRVPRHPGGFRPPAGPPLATLDQLAAVVDAGRRVGIERLRAALPLIRTGSSSRPESIGRLELARGGLPEPVLDFDVYDGERFLGCSEMAYPKFKVAIEYEGDHHRTSRRQWNRDIEKYQAYAEAGWRVVRLTSADLFGRPGEAVRRVDATLRARGWRPR